MLVIIIAIIIVDIIIGAIVWSLIDDNEQQLLKWYKESPYALLNVIILLGWPVGLFFWLKNSINRENSSK